MVIKKKPSKKIAKILSRAFIHFNAGELREADALCCQILQKHPENADALHLYGLLADRVGRYRIAEEMISRAIKYKPTSSVFHNNLGIILLTLGKRDEANSEFERAVQLKPDYKDAVRNLADSLEKSNEQAAAREIVDRGLKKNPGDPHLLLISAKLERREANHEKVITILCDALRSHQDLTPLIEGEIHQVLGQTYDRVDNTKIAFEHFITGNRIISSEGLKRGHHKQNYTQMMDDLENKVSPELGTVSISDFNSEEMAPVFLVGFPRSGTTLLDQILNSHPGVFTIEEKPPVDVMHETYHRLNYGNPPLLASLDSSQIQQMQESYFSERKIYTLDNSEPIIIDKMPLNTWRAPLIWRTFSNAKFIFSIRHPCDVCLSCFMQYFTVNDAMSHFFSLEDAANFYAKVMGLWIKYSSDLPLNYHTIRYEDLINNVELEARNILEFLGADWNDDVLRHTEKASQRKAINTPSYHQVTQPIYKHAEYRWKRYEKQFEPVMDTLAPFIEHFGYEK